MRRNIEIIAPNSLKNFSLPNHLEEIGEEDEEIKDKENINYIPLMRVNTSNSTSINKEKEYIHNILNPTLSNINNEIPNEFDEFKVENNNNNDKNIFKHKKNSSINVLRNKKGSFSKLFRNNKIIYIKKRNNDVKDIRESRSNKIIKKDFFQENETELKEKEIIKEIKESVICYICLMKIEKPRICPNCNKIACEQCLKNWFDKGNNNCGYCRAALSFDKMVSVPIINNVVDLIDTISSKNKAKKMQTCYTKIKKNLKKFDLINDVIKEEICESNNNDIMGNSINIECLQRMNNNNESIYLNKNKNNISHSTHNPYNSMLIESKSKDLSNEEFCPKHPDQPLFYYCVDCKQAYCRTCFVFFGEEKDKHNAHNIIEYNKYKSMNIPEVIKNSKYLDDKYEEIEAYIKRCQALKNCYEFERNLVQEQVKELMNKFNNNIDENIKKLDDILKTYNNYLIQINKCKNDVNQFYINQKCFPDLIENLNNIKAIKYFNSKEIDNFCDLTKNMELKVYQTEFKKCEIKQNNYHFKLPLNDSKYQLAITKKRNEVQIYIYWPGNRDINEEKEKNNNLLPIIFMRKKNKNWESFQLSEFLNYKGNNYYIKRFSANNFCSPNSYFKIKGILYEYNIE